MKSLVTNLRGLVAFAAWTAQVKLLAEEPKVNTPTELAITSDAKTSSDKIEPRSSSEADKPKPTVSDSKSLTASNEDNYRTSFVFVGKVTGMVCSACVRNVRTAIERVPGVSHVDIRPNASGGPAEVEITSSRSNLSKDDITRSLGGTKRVYDLPDLQISKVEIKPAAKKS
jgi:copper chaperone CopZ